MRIISQDGMIDVPYEQFIISLNAQDMNEVIAWTAEHIKDDECITLAHYFTEAKARKAMEMLRKAYAGLPIIMQNVEIPEDVVEMFEEWQKQGIFVRAADNQPSKVEFLNNVYFQFPADDEVED